MISAKGSTAPRVYAGTTGRLAFARMGARPQVIGVVGAGTMGAGIAQLGALSGARTLLHDPDDGALDRALERIPAQLDRGAEKGRWMAEDARDARDRLQGGGARAQPARRARRPRRVRPDRRGRPRVAAGQARALRRALADRARRGARLEHVLHPD